MPIITVKLAKGRSIELKRALVKAATEAVVSYPGCQTGMGFGAHRRVRPGELGHRRRTARRQVR
jgi:hypothetical protein